MRAIVRPIGWNEGAYETDSWRNLGRLCRNAAFHALFEQTTRGTAADRGSGPRPRPCHTGGRRPRTPARRGASGLIVSDASATARPTRVMPPHAGTHASRGLFCHDGSTRVMPAHAGTHASPGLFCHDGSTRVMPAHAGTHAFRSQSNEGYKSTQSQFIARIIRTLSARDQFLMLFSRAIADTISSWNSNQARRPSP